MRKVPRKWFMGGVAAVATVATLIGATGVGFAAASKWQRVSLHWNLNLTDADNGGTCQQTASQVAYLPPDSHPGEWITMVAADWEERCNTATSRVSSRARRTEQGRIEVDIRLGAIATKANVGNFKSGKVSKDPNTPGVEPVEIKLDSSQYATAFGRFTLGTKAKDGYEPRWAKYHTGLNQDGIDGNATLEVYQTGQYIFEGHMHNSNFASKDVKMTCAVVKTNGEAMTFEIAGDLDGTLAALGGNKSFDWSEHHTSYDVSGAFRDEQSINEESPMDCHMSVETDTGNDVAGGALILINIFKAIF